MQSDIRAVFLDIDGTLVSYNTHRIHPEDYAAMEQARKNGVKLFIATGRDLNSYSESRAIEPLRPVMDGYVSSNGQQSFLSDMTLVAQHPLDEEDMAAIIRTCDENGLSILYEKDHRMYVNRMTPPVKTFADMLDMEVPAVLPLPNPAPKLYKACVYVNHEEEAKYILPILHHTRTAHSRGDLIDLIPEGLGKETGITDLGAYFGFTPAQSMAIGDGDNDISILKAAGIGVAMGNAFPEVKAIADYVTVSADEAGIAHAFRHFGLID